MAALILLMATPSHAVRIKDVARFDGVRPNQLIGYGLVVGLDQTGDSKRTSFHQSIACSDALPHGHSYR